MWDGAQMGLEAYRQGWYHGDYDCDEVFWDSDFPEIDEAIDYAFHQVESGRVKPRDFRGYFRSQAKKRFRELAEAALRRQEERPISSA